MSEVSLTGWMKALIALLAFLVGSSLYTLFWLYSVLH
jgi:hypothetical protein